MSLLTYLMDLEVKCYVVSKVKNQIPTSTFQGMILCMKCVCVNLTPVIVYIDIPLAWLNDVLTTSYQPNTHTLTHSLTASYLP